MVLGLIGGILAIGAACDTSDKRHGFMTSVERKKFDQENARDGIHWGEIDRIAARCRVKSSKYGVLPADGYLKCLDYVRKYANGPSDVDNFINMWKITVQKQVLDEPNRVKSGKYAQKYHLTEQLVSQKVKTMDRNNLLTFEIAHWLNISRDEHRHRMEQVATKSAIKDILARPPTLRWGSTWANERVEYWTIFGQPGEQVGYVSKKNFQGIYRKCCAHCGYDAEL